MGRKGYFLPKVEMKEYNVIINGRNCFDQLIRNNINIYENIKKIATGQGVITQLVVY